MLIAGLSQVFVPGHTEPVAKKWPATTVLTRFAIQDDDHHADHGAATGSAAEPDDLTRIEGIGPKLQEILYGGGLRTYQALSQEDPQTLRTVIKEAGFSAPFDPESWPEQATLAAAGKWDELDELQGRLVAGRTA